MDQEGTIVWKPAPQWDDQKQGWYWQGSKREGKGRSRNIVPVTRFLQPEEFGADGYPLPGLQPPSGGQPASASAPRSEGFDHVKGEQSLSYPVSSSPPQVDGNYYLDPRSLDQGRPGQSQSVGAPFELDGQAALPSTYELQGRESSGSRHKISNQVEDSQAGFGQVPSTIPYDGSSSYQQLPYGTSNTPNQGKHGHHKSRRSDKKSWDEQSLSTEFDSAMQLGNSEALGSGNDFFPGSASEEAYNKGSKRGSSKYATGLPVISEKRPGGAFQPASSYSGDGSYYNSNQFGSPSSNNAGLSSGTLAMQPEDVTAPPEIRVSHEGKKHIKKIPEVNHKKTSMLDPSFFVHSSWEFKPGKIISIMWFEPKGKDIGKKGAFGSQITTSQTVAQSKQDYWAGFRRFIVIRSHEGHSTCVPIYTYRNQGCNKPGIKHSQHGVIYEDVPGKFGALLPGERTLGFSAVRAKSTGNYMDDASRVNYSKLASVPHNKEVAFIGDVVIEDWPIVFNAVVSFFGHSSR